MSETHLKMHLINNMHWWMNSQVDMWWVVYNDKLIVESRGVFMGVHLIIILTFLYGWKFS